MKKIVKSLKIIEYFIISSIAWLALGIIIGVAASIQLSFPIFNLFEGVSYGRLAPIHYNLMIYGFCFNAIFGIYYYIAIHLIGSTIVRPILARIQLILYNIAVGLATISMFFGATQSLRYMEYEWLFDVCIEAALLLFVINLAMMIKDRKALALHISMYYIIASSLGLFIVYTLANLPVPISLFGSVPYYASGAMLAMDGWFAQTLAAFLFIATIFAILHYFLTMVLKVRLYSEKIAVNAFISFIVGYIIISASQMAYMAELGWVQGMAFLAYMIIFFSLIATLFNIYVTIRDNWGAIRGSYLAKFVVASLLSFTILLCGAFIFTSNMSEFLQYTDWQFGYIHFGMMGALALLITAFIYYTITRLYNIQLYDNSLVVWHFTLVTIALLFFGFFVMVHSIWQASLLYDTVDGIFQFTFLEALNRTALLRFGYILTGLLYAVGIAIFVYNIVKSIIATKALNKANNEK